MTINTRGDVHGDHQDHHRDVHHRARRQGGTGDGEQLRVPGRQELLPLRHLPPGHPRVRGPDRRPDRDRHRRARLQFADENIPKAYATGRTWRWPTRAGTRHQRAASSSSWRRRSSALASQPRLRVDGTGHGHPANDMLVNTINYRRRLSSACSPSPFTRRNQRGVTTHGHTRATRRRRVEPATAQVRPGAADGHRPRQALHGHHGDLPRHHGDRARPPGGAQDGEQLRLPRPLPLLRRGHLPPHHPGLRAPGWRPHGHRHRRPRVQVRGRAAGAGPLPGGIAGHGQCRPQHQREPVLHHQRIRRRAPATAVRPLRRRGEAGAMS